MIDFRYHIVSLISVFLALAVGIVLGAGPLRDYIADSLSGQVDNLREEADNLRDQLEDERTAVGSAEAFIDASSPALIADSLPGYTVTLVTMPGMSSELTTQTIDTLTQAGASVLNIVEVTKDFTDPAKAAFRSGIAGSMSEYMDPAPADDASGETVLGAALDQGLTGYDPAAPQDPSEDAVAIFDLLRSSELVTADGQIQPTLLTVILGSDSSGPEAERAAELGLVKGFDPGRVVVAGVDGSLNVATGVESDTTLVHLLRADSGAADTFTTVDSITRTTGQTILPRALALVVDGQQGSFGSAPGVTGPLPPIVDIAEPEPIEPIVEDEPGDEASTADDAADDSEQGEES